MTNIHLKRQIDRLVKVIADKYHPEKIILFGSAARGQTGSDSDVDLFIVKSHNQPRPRRGAEVYEILRKLSNRPPVDVVVYTPEEVRHRLELGDWFVKEVFEEGRVMYG